MKKGNNRFILLATLLFSLPFLGIVFILVQNINKDIKTAKIEQYGVKYHSALFSLLIASEQYSGEVFASKNVKNPSMAQKDLGALKEEITQDIQLVDEIDRQFGANLDARERWDSTKQKITELIAALPGRTASNTLDSQSVAIEVLSELMNRIATAANLVSDPDIYAYYMANITTQPLTNMSKYIASLRTRLPPLIADGKIADGEKYHLISIYGKIEENRDQYHYDTSVISEKYQDNTYQGVEITTRIVPKLNKILLLINEINDGETVAPDVFYSAATDLIEAFQTAYHLLSVFLNDRLQQRIDRLAWLRLEIFASSAAIFVVMVGFFVVALRNSVRREELDSARQMQAVMNTVVDGIITIDQAGIVQSVIRRPSGCSATKRRKSLARMSRC